ncbi:hypothetical protein TBLA_0H01260 [Henningerozyma blattae CBS 6284]|uniref:C2H2-type domain-containing protein n=1 Tax=Henningerozyma blattae (strain ATCC 34711 / CBS 6284 / DSM 70876 / NBRC 10599 / NRRL Y-10934 / UCD 77-7) TaxID=1071380 RepID=I2H7R1_HENB6|nr:hypothetical protein TBLA_0H01260 [Tetrapisispora blattae CBS 6284]CCH62413.1 hypothetical protein TBLA_0H01260 [Tetrapisispora blattae CBS 6284]
MKQKRGVLQDIDMNSGLSNGFQSGLSQENLLNELEHQKALNRQLEEQLKYTQLQQEELKKELGRSSFDVPLISPPSNTYYNGSPSRRNKLVHKYITPLINDYENGEANMLGNNKGLDIFETNTELTADIEAAADAEADADASASASASAAASASASVSASASASAFAYLFNEFDTLPSSPMKLEENIPYTPRSEAMTPLISPERSNFESNFEPNFEPAMGLGLHTTQGKQFILKPPPLDLLPTIPGSKENTPFKTPFPFDLFETSLGDLHTPSKNDHNPNDNELINDNELTTNNELTYDFTTTTHNASASHNATHNPPTLRHPSTTTASDEPESLFILSGTPSPVLKSQGPTLDPNTLARNRLRRRAPPNSPRHSHIPKPTPHVTGIPGTGGNSPSRASRKLSTLPQGAIDQYVREIPDRLFECIYPGCHKIFKRRYNIRSHIQTHLEDRPYVCDHEGCTKAFVRNHDLLRHKKTHAEKTHVCPCGKRFNREDALIVHRSRMICDGGKRYANVVIKRSPRRRGRPRKTPGLGTTSPVKQLQLPLQEQDQPHMTRDRRDQERPGFVVFKLAQE